jgi:hypothetical protein
LPWVLKGLYLSEDATVSFHKDGDNTVIGFNEKKPQTDDLKHFYNLGESSWSLPLTKLSLDNFNFDVISKEFKSQGASNPIRLGLIDSASNTITVGKGDFEEIKEYLKKKDPSIEVR